MEKNTVLISLLATSKAPSFSLPAFSLSESSQFSPCFSVHPFPSSHLSCCPVLPAMLHTLLHPFLVFLKALNSFVYNRCYFLSPNSCLIFCVSLLSFLLQVSLSVFFSSGPSPSLLTFGSLSADLQHIFFHIFFLVSFYQIILSFSYSILLKRMFTSVYPSCFQHTHSLLTISQS